MAFRRRRSRKVTVRKKRAQGWASYVTPSNAVRAYSMARSAWTGLQYLKGLVNSETFNADRTFALGATQSDIFGISRISQGDGQNERTGNSVLVRSIYLRGYMQVNPSVTGNTRVSLALVQDTQQISDTNPAVLDIFNSITPEAMINRSNTNNTAGRFKIIWRKNYNLTPSTGSTPNINIDKYFKVYSHVKFNGTANTDIQKNGYYLVILTSEATNYPTVSMTSRICYHDN